ncbi:MAG TPA: hypothetical protein GX708_03870, partial [Gallicola sp.]|nr:hypothetical protein [Gallicola sp.]
YVIELSNLEYGIRENLLKQEGYLENNIKINSQLTPQQKQQAQQLYSQYLSQNPNGSVEGFKSWVDGNRSNVLYQLQQGREIEEFVASEKTIRDLAARMSDRIGIPVRFESDRTKEYKGKLENNIAVVNLAYATLDTPIHEILGHAIIRAIKYGEKSSLNYHITSQIEKTNKRIELSKQFRNKKITKEEYEKQKQSLDKEYTREESQLYQNLLKELEYGKGKEVFDRIKRDYVFKKEIPYMSIIKKDTVLYYNKNTKTGYIHDNNNPNERKIFNSEQEIRDYLELNDKYTLEEQQEEAIVELLGLMTAEKLDKVKDGKLISLLKRLLKEIKAFMKQLLGQREVEIDKLPDNMTLGDIADLLAYSNSKLILPGYEVIYTTPDNQQFKTYAEASNHISNLAKNVTDVDLDNVKLRKNLDKDNPLNDFYIPEQGRFYIKEGEYFFDSWNGTTYKQTKDQFLAGWNNYIFENIEGFIEKNKEYEQSKEIIEEWKKVNNIQYNPEEVYSRGQEFVSVIGAYSDFDVNLMMQNLLQHIEDNQKAGGEFTISAFTKPVGKQIGHLEGGGGKIKFKIYPQSQDIKWAANTDVYSGSVWDASEKVSKDKKSELLGVRYTKYPSLRNVNAVQPNLADIIDNLDHHHNELGITLTGSNFRLEYDEDVPYSTKKIIDSINSILDQKYGKLVKPVIEKQIKNLTYTALGEYNQEKRNSVVKEFKTKEEAVKWIEQNKEQYEATTGSKLVLGEFWDEGIQPTQTNKTLKESIESVKNKIEKFQRIKQYEAEYNEFNSKKENVLRFRPKNYDSSFDQEYYAESLEQAKT